MTYSAAAPFRSPTARLIIAVVVAFALVVPIFFVWMLVYDRQQQSEVAQASIAEGWGGPQVIAGPLLVLPYRATREETVTENGRQVVRQVDEWEQRTIAPELVELTTSLNPERRTRSIYEAIVYEARAEGRARFAIPADVARYGIDPARLDLSRAELRFGLSDPRGLGANPSVSVGGTALRLQPGGGTGATGGSGFFAWMDAAALATGPFEVRFAFRFRGNRSLTLTPQAGETRWSVTSSWQHPSFQGSFLPEERSVDGDGFRATYQVGNLALGQSLVTPGAAATVSPPEPTRTGPYPPAPPETTATPSAQINLMQPVDLYSQVGRATKYGFLFVGFTFLALLLFDIVGGVRVSGAEYLLVGVGLILFFVLLLAFAEVVGFGPAYLIASAAITGLITLYSASVLKSRRRAGGVAVLLTVLYAVLYLLLSLEAYSLLIGSVLLFAALAAVMYLTRNLNWGGAQAEGEALPGGEEASAAAH
jgi:inner membrane protein